jgi:hypothetical protein
MMKGIMFIVLTLSVCYVLFMTSCNLEDISDGVQNIQADSTQTALLALEQEIDTLIGEANCESTSQCRSIGFGDKPCGGFWEYLVYSIKDTDTLLVQGKVKQYNALDEQRNKEQNTVSDCAYLLEPELECREMKCSSI